LCLIDHPSNVWLSGTDKERIQWLHTAYTLCVCVCVCDPVLHISYSRVRDSK
jgi:hypothetical protein